MNYDLMVVGAGPGGYEAAIRAAQEGMKVAIIERGELGGVCLNRGCIPTKTLMHSANLYRELMEARRYGLSVGEIGFEIEKIYARKEEVVSRLREGIKFLLSANRVDCIAGHAVLKGPGTVQVGAELYEAERILLAVGSEPSLPPIAGVEQALTSDDLLDQSVLYPRLTIIGGGVIGVELADLFAALGSEVTILEEMERILPVQDREISQNLSMLFGRQGVRIVTRATVSRIEVVGGERVCHFVQQGQVQQVCSDAVLIATGRRANLGGLLGKGVQLRCDQGIIVNDHFQTSLPGVWAIGDAVQGAAQLAHVAAAQGLNAVADMLGKEPEIDLLVVPSCIYTNPEIASVGWTQMQAEAAGCAVKIGKSGAMGNGKSLIEAQEQGFAKLVFDAESEVLLGAQLLCGRATDLISELATAVANHLTAGQLARVIRPHPTFAEMVTEAVEDLHGRAIHTPPRWM